MMLSSASHAPRRMPTRRSFSRVTPIVRPLLGKTTGMILAIEGLALAALRRIDR